MNENHDVRPSNQTGGGTSALQALKLDAGVRETPSPQHPDPKLHAETAQKKPYFLLSNFRTLKPISTTKGPEIANPLTNGPLALKKVNDESEAGTEDFNDLGRFLGGGVSKTLALDSALGQRVVCRLCQRDAESPIEKESLCITCQDQRDGSLLPMLKESDAHPEKLAQKSCGFSLFNTERAKQQFIDSKKDPKAIALKIDQLQARKSKVLCTNELSSTLRNLPSSTGSNIKLTFAPSLGEKKTNERQVVNLRNSPKTLDQKSTLSNHARVSPESLDEQRLESQPNSGKFIKRQPDNPADMEPSINLKANLPSVVSGPLRRAGGTLANNPAKPIPPSKVQPRRQSHDSRSSSAASGHQRGKGSDSSNGRSDEQLCRAFSVDRSLTMTVKVSSVKVSESIETDPDVERSMRYEENRTLSFLNEEDEVLDRVNEQPKSTLRKNKLKLTSGKFLVSKKYSVCDEKTAPANPLINVISSHPLPFYNNPVFVNMSANLSHNEASMFSTQDSRPGQNKSLNYEQLRQGCEPISDSKPKAGVTFTPTLRPFPSLPPYGVFPADLNPRFMRDRVAPMEAEVTSNGFEQMHESFAIPQFDLNQNLSMVSVPSTEEDAQKKNRARKCQPVTNAKEFDINPSRIFDLRKTTLMIKNIPNRYTKEMMLETIDKRFKERYNFFYLPIDFDNNCNVGYAFINFTDLNFIYDFFLEFNGSHWPNFKSDKICEITYARIQGKEACIQHFKDSSLMKQEVSQQEPQVQAVHQAPWNHPAADQQAEEGKHWAQTI